MTAGISFVGQIQLVAFCLFEVTVGVFWPSLMKMRSQYVPEEMRSTIINLFRIPLNLFVCIVLYNVRPPCALHAHDEGFLVDTSLNTPAHHAGYYKLCLRCDWVRVLQVSKFPLSAMFGMCSVFLVVAGLCQRRLDALVTAAGLASLEVHLGRLPEKSALLSDP